MTSISIIGLGGMARAIAARAVEGGNTVEVIGRDAAKANDLAARARQRSDGRHLRRYPGR